MSIQKIDDLIDTGEEKEEPKSDTRTSLKGEEIPDEVKTPPKYVEDKILSEDEEEPSKPEEPAEQAPEGTEDEEVQLTDEEKRFVELGLDKQFKGGISEAIERLPEMNKYITALEHQRNALREQTATPPKEEPFEAPSGDDLYNDPVGVISKIVEAQTKGFNERFEQLQIDQFKASKSDFQDMLPYMREELNNNPAIGSLDAPTAVSVLYQMAKAQQLSKARPPQPPPAPSPNKESAETSTGKKSPPVDKNNLEYWHGKSLKEMENELGVAPKYND